MITVLRTLVLPCLTHSPLIPRDIEIAATDANNITSQLLEHCTTQEPVVIDHAELLEGTMDKRSAKNGGGPNKIGIKT